MTNSLHIFNEVIMYDSTETIINEFTKEFQEQLKFFEIIQEPVSMIKLSTNPFIKNQGCYVFWNPKFNVIKVGKSCSRSAITRAFEHIKDNTNKGECQMRDLKDDENTFLLLFNLKENDWEKSRKLIHWVVCLESYFENKLNPYIPSRRKC